jgi:hypothetical protein
MADTTDHVRTGFGNGVPEPVRNGDGAPIMGPLNVPLERENPDHDVRRPPQPGVYLVGPVVGAIAAAFGYRWLVLYR